MFSGQGSHYYQMGKDLYESHPVFRSQMEQGDAIVRALAGRSVLDELFRHPISMPFDDLVISHPALIMLEYALFRVLVSEGIVPDCVWGSSAGEFAAGIAWYMVSGKRAGNIGRAGGLGGAVLSSWRNACHSWPAQLV